MNKYFLKKAEELKPRLCIKKISADGKYDLSEGESVVFDFGTHCTGYPKLHFSFSGLYPDAPALVKLRFCETREELDEDTSSYCGWISKSWIQEELVHIDSLPCDYVCKRRYAFRYIQVEAVGLSQKFKLLISDAQTETVTSAPEYILPCGNNSLEKEIDAVALKTLSECMQDVFEDGPKRDRRLWLGDLRLQALANYCTYAHNDLVKRCLYLFAATADDNGKISQSVFTVSDIVGDEDSLFDYSLLFIATLVDYYEATGDKQTAKELFPLAVKQVENARRQFEGDIVQDCDRIGWCFLDWSLQLNKQAGAQAVYIYAEKALIKLCKYLEQPYEEYAEDVVAKSKSAISTFYDRSLGLFVSGKEKQVSYATNIWYVIAGVFSQEQNQTILHKLQNCEDAIIPITPYLMHHYIQALIDSGLKEEGKEVMLSYWGGMVKTGADTFWELYNPKNPWETPYGGKAVNSYCHAWSCTPVYFIRKYFSK